MSKRRRAVLMLRTQVASDNSRGSGAASHPWESQLQLGRRGLPYFVTVSRLMSRSSLLLDSTVLTCLLGSRPAQPGVSPESAPGLPKPERCPGQWLLLSRSLPLRCRNIHSARSRMLSSCSSKCTHRKKLKWCFLCQVQRLRCAVAMVGDITEAVVDGEYLPYVSALLPPADRPGNSSPGRSAGPASTCMYAAVAGAVPLQYSKQFITRDADTRV